MNVAMRFLHKIWKTLKVGHARMVYSDLYSAGAINQEEYLQLLEKVDKDEETVS